MDARVTPGLEAGGGDAEDGAVGVEAGASCRVDSDCDRSQLCCSGACVPTSEARCATCDQGCSGATANACNARACVCGNEGECKGDTPHCVTNGGTTACAECRDATDCASNGDGRTQCIQGSCAACNPADNAGCSGNTPICNARTMTCEACTTTPDNCPGTPVCTASGACGGCTENDAADCTNPTTPICNLAITPSMCRGCASNAECMTELSRPYCVGNQRCSTCNPVNDMGCDAASATPDCRLNGNGQYQCQACNSSSCPTGTRCQTGTGRCVECRADSDCDPASARPYCDTTSGTCRGCNTVTGIGGTAWCALNSLLSRPICHTSGRCVACDASNQGCASPTGRCYVRDAANPQNNQCVECRPGVAGDCGGATAICGTNFRCRGCAAVTEAADCPPAAGLPVCASGTCVRCRVGMSGVPAQCAANQVCVAGTNGPECAQCDGHEDCTNAAAPLCNTATHTCVPCGMVANTSACSAKTAGTLCTARGRCEACDLSNPDRGCSADQLCCETGGTTGCVPSSNSQCAACGVACTAGEMCMPAMRMCVAVTPPDAGTPDGG